MHLNFIRRGMLIIALAWPLGGCLETVGHPPYNHGPTPPVQDSCRPVSQSAGEVIEYGCNPGPDNPLWF
jgi:hypothetical protein